LTDAAERQIADRRQSPGGEPGTLQETAAIQVIA
jgi:hypothetical protein